MNPAILNGVTRLIGFLCLVAAAAVRFGLAASLATAGVLLLIQAAPPFSRRLLRGNAG